MLPSDCIAKLLDVEHLEIINIEHKAGEIMLEVRMKRRASRCPGSSTVNRTKIIRYGIFCIPPVTDSPVYHVSVCC